MSLQPWQRANLLAAANYFRQLNASGAASARSATIHQGLLEILDPARRVTRLQREMAEAEKAEARHEERRAAKDRRQKDRRKVNLGWPAHERRNGTDRRSGRDRRGPRHT